MRYVCTTHGPGRPHMMLGHTCRSMCGVRACVVVTMCACVWSVSVAALPAARLPGLQESPPHSIRHWKGPSSVCMWGACGAGGAPRPNVASHACAGIKCCWLPRCDDVGCGLLSCVACEAGARSLVASCMSPWCHHAAWCVRMHCAPRHCGSGPPCQWHQRSWRMWYCLCVGRG